MIVELVGGRSCGLVMDLNDPKSPWRGALDLPLPDVLEMHVSRANRTAYRLMQASPDSATYVIDAALTAEYRSRDLKT